MCKDNTGLECRSLQSLLGGVWPWRSWHAGYRKSMASWVCRGYMSSACAKYPKWVGSKWGSGLETNILSLCQREVVSNCCQRSSAIRNTMYEILHVLTEIIGSWYSGRSKIPKSKISRDWNYVYWNRKWRPLFLSAQNPIYYNLGMAPLSSYITTASYYLPNEVSLHVICCLYYIGAMVIFVRKHYIKYSYHMGELCVHRLEL